MNYRGDDRNDWLEQANCRGKTYWMYGNVWPEANVTDTRLDDGNIHDGVALAAAMCYCDNCPVIDECEDTVMEQERGHPLEDRFGITAGMTPQERWLADGRPVRIEPQEG